MRLLPGARLVGNYGYPDYSRSGIARGTSALSSQPARTATLAVAANAVNAASEKGQLEDGDFLALVTSGGVVKPLAVDTLKQWLEATYVMTLQP